MIITEEISIEEKKKEYINNWEIQVERLASVLIDLWNDQFQAHCS